MGGALARLMAFGLSVLVAEGAALACDPLDINCNPPPADPCSAYAGTSDYNVCRSVMPKCPNMVGPPLSSCLSAEITIAKNSTSTATTTTTGTSTSASTSTVNRAIGYQATMTNTSLYDPVVSTNAQVSDVVVHLDANGNVQETDGPGTLLNQKDALGAQSKLMLACTATNLQGRNDGACATNPNLPECTGMTSALGDATTCVKSSPPDPKTGKTTCLQYGSYGYSLDEWLVFGQQYFNGMTGCFAVGDKTETSGAEQLDPNLMVSRETGLDGFGDFARVPPQQPGTGIDGTSASTISGAVGMNTASGTQTQTVRWKAIADQIDDGASYLGLERGELIKRAANGQTFLSAFNDSPFADSLAQTLRDTVVAALSDPAETVARAKEKSQAAIEANGGDGAGAGATGGSAAAGPGNALAAGTAGPAARGNVAGAGALSGGAGSAGAAGLASAAAGGRDPASLGRQAYGAASPTVSGRAGFRDPRDARAARSRELADARALFAGKPRAAAEGAGAPVQSAGDGLAGESTLFERVTRSYRRHARDLKGFDESKTARDVRLTEKPEFFQDL